MIVWAGRLIPNAMSQLHNSVLDLARARLGKVVCGKWRVEKLLGLGGMAAVYEAIHVKNSARVALKMLHPQLSVNEEVRKRFAREGYVANTVGHPGVPRVLDDDTAEDGSAFLVMDLLEGETADQRAERSGGKLLPQDVAGIGDAILDVLAAAHSRGIIHRDIKPENVFLTNDQRVILLDFGIARVIDQAATTETKNGEMMGTPAFMPPEQARGRANEMDATSDVWAVGATLFYLLAGRVVHTAETANEQLVAAATLPAPSLAQVTSGVPTPLVDVIDRSLEYTKGARYPDARAMQQALRDAIEAISWGGKLPPGFNLARPPTPAIPIPIAPPPTSDALPLAAQQRQAPTEISVRVPPAAESARNPTLGPMVMADEPRSRTRMALAIAVGAVAASLVVGVAFFALRTPPKAAASSASLPVAQTERPSATVPVATVTAEPSASVSAVPTVAVSALPTASTAAPSPSPHAVQPARPATTAGKNTWLDRRN